ncbi:helix-turn-helix domain-containing protein [Metabacillus sp. GX 13764]|uniref:XRE family transcriptional regulator n=1 Tax=Metabacillus kandeliae TaxID=2900151 RepID=UPI001E4F80A5|nr:XRE family transcriptional regulator [Metabacillus kandeliae]MCD7033167.1 helix-turn-helix domain-containing protein [Metabacillus kandeliae]
MIGERIRQLRRMKGYSLSELAELAGVSKSYLSYIERDIQKNPSLQFLTKIAETLDTDVNDLLHDKDSSKSVDEEWLTILEKAINEGMTKDDFRYFRDYIRFKKWQDDQNEEDEEIDD